jgi:benzodiazapine receptor
MPEKSAPNLRSVLVVIATLGMIGFNSMAAIGYINETTPKMISDKNLTILTPADYAFSIWSLIYVGLTAFSIYQLLARRFEVVRTPYILSCVLNCAWIYFWLFDSVLICLLIIIALWLSLLWTYYAASPGNGRGDTWFVKAPLGLYAGWVTVAGLVNLAVAARRVDFDLSTLGGVVLVAVGAAIGVAVAVTMRNYFFPLAVAWALTAIAIKQSGHTAIVVSAAVGVVACLISALSFVINFNDRSNK